MRRLFSQKEKKHLYLVNEGGCEKCGGDLGNDWEAHHVVRYANGGVTELTNAMALCYSCHKKIHGGFMIEPRGWQKNAIKKFTNHRDMSFLLEATPGAGKTVFSCLCAKYLFDEDEIDFAIIVVPTTPLKGDADSGFLGDWHKCGLNITTKLSTGKGMPKDFHGAVITYQQLPEIVETLSTWAHNKRLFFVFDEIHHARTNVWGNAVSRCGTFAVKVLGMTGTLFASDGQRIVFVNYGKDDKAIPDATYSYTQAVKDKVCRPVSFMTDDSTVSYIHNEEAYEHQISNCSPDEEGRSTAVVFSKDNEWLEEVVVKADTKLDEYRATDADAGGLIICRAGKDENDDRHLIAVAKQVKRWTGEMPIVITHEDRDANAKIALFRKNSHRWMCAVRKISEGVDIKRLRVLVMANRPTTELLFRQIVGRVVRHEDKSVPEDSTVYIAKFPQLVEWGERIRKEAETGLKDPVAPIDPSDPTDRDGESSFFGLGATHENGGAISDYGEMFSDAEIDAAEQMKTGDRQLINFPVTTLAHVLRVAGVTPPIQALVVKPLAIQKKELRDKINKSVRQIAVASGEYSKTYTYINGRANVKSIDDLYDNHSLDKMHQYYDMVKSVQEQNMADLRKTLGAIIK